MKNYAQNILYVISFTRNLENIINYHNILLMYRSKCLKILLNTPFLHFYETLSVNANHKCHHFSFGDNEKKGVNIFEHLYAERKATIS